MEQVLRVEHALSSRGLQATPHATAVS